MSTDLVIENDRMTVPGDYVIRLSRCRYCHGEGGLCLPTHKVTCTHCGGTGRLGEVQQWPRVALDTDAVLSAIATSGAVVLDADQAAALQRVVGRAWFANIKDKDVSIAADLDALAAALDRGER